MHPCIFIQEGKKAIQWAENVVKAAGEDSADVSSVQEFSKEEVAVQLTY